MTGIVLGVLNILSSGLNLVVGRGLQPSDFISVVVAAIILVYFFTPRVRQAFGRA
jgi:antibiotic biosynthesis monooxygenase (ABM) superfamily enzyme